MFVQARSNTLFEFESFLRAARGTRGGPIAHRLRVLASCGGLVAACLGVAPRALMGQQFTCANGTCVTGENLASIDTVGTYLMGNSGPSGNFRQGVGLNWYWNGSNWVTISDGANNGGSLILNSESDGNLHFYTTNGSGSGVNSAGLAQYDRMVITNLGNVGIGTTTPILPLHVYGTANPPINSGIVQNGMMFVGGPGGNGLFTGVDNGAGRYICCLDAIRI